MIKIANTQFWVHDQDEALRFYTKVLGWEVRADVTMQEWNFRWLAVGPAGQDQVGLVLMRQKAVTTLASIAQKNGAQAVAGVEPGDALLAVDGAGTAPMTRGALLAALHGKPGETHRLSLLRDGKRVTVDAPVTAF